MGFNKKVTKEFEIFGSTFKASSASDVAAVLLGKSTKKEYVDIEDIKAKHKGVQVYEEHTNTFDVNKGELEPVVYYYTGAKAVNAKKYKAIGTYDADFPPKNMLIECILQVEDFKTKVYVPIKNHNCSMMDLIDDVKEYIMDELNNSPKFDDDDDSYTKLYMYSDGGWELDYDIDLTSERDVESLIVSIRLVEEAV